MSGESISVSNMKFGELLTIINCPTKIYKLPTAKQLRKGGEEILFTEDILDAKITVYQNGYIIYERDKHATVTSVDCCASPEYTFTASEDELENGTHVVGCTGRIVKDRGGAMLLSKIPMEAFLNEPWYAPIVVICEARLDNNMESREESHEGIHYDDEEFEWNDALLSPSIEDDLGLNEPETMTEREIQILALQRAKSKWTTKQSEAIRLYHFQNMTDEQVGRAMSEPCNQQMANRHRHAAYKKVVKEYKKIKKGLM